MYQTFFLHLLQKSLALICIIKLFVSIKHNWDFYYIFCYIFHRNLVISSQKFQLYAKSMNTKIFKVYVKNQYFMKLIIDVIGFYENFLFLQNNSFFVMCTHCLLIHSLFLTTYISFRLASVFLSYFSFNRFAMN